MPLIMACPGESVNVERIGGRQEIKRHLEDLGFTGGTPVTVLQSHDGDMIVKVRDTKLALTREMAEKIMVSKG